MARRPIIQPAVLRTKEALPLPFPGVGKRPRLTVRTKEIKRAQGVNLMPAELRPGQSILGQAKQLPVPVQLYRIGSAKAAHLCRVTKITD
jgi:hypothetical protein